MLFGSQYTEISTDDAIAFLVSRGYTVLDKDDPGATVGGCHFEWTDVFKQYAGYVYIVLMALVLLNILWSLGFVGAQKQVHKTKEK